MIFPRIPSVLRTLLFATGLLALIGRLAAAEVSAAAPAAPPAPNSDASCLECHSDEKLTMKKGAKKISLFVDAKHLKASSHNSLACIDCHEGFDGEQSPHKKKITPVDCLGCHEKTGKKHLFHAKLSLAKPPAGQDTDCAGCHGTHAVATVKSPQFPFRDGKQAEGCGKCHEKDKAQFLASAHGIALKRKAPSSPDCLGCHRQSIVNKDKTKPITVEQKLAQAKLCESCHVDKKEVADKTVLGGKFVMAFENSVHGKALKQGKADAAGCVDCHGSHETSQAMRSNSRTHQLQVASTCAKCHKDIAKDYDSSVHAMALKRGNHDSPSCTRCHGEHDIRSHKDPASPIHAKNMAQEVCASCHASLRLTAKYGLSSDRFQTFNDSYHGLAVRGGAVEVVNCASCHSSHAIKSHLDPSSTVHKENLVKTCGQCHPGANTAFAVGSVHASEDQKDKSPLLYWIANLYVLLIVVVVGGMAVHNFLDFLKKARRKLAIQKGLIEEEHVEHRLYLRMSAHERVQHAVLVISFVALVVTGFMLRYPEAWWVVAIHKISASAFEWRSLLHRIAGVIMLAGGAWHVAYLAFSPRGRQLLIDLWPRWRDVTDPWKVLRYNLGLADTKPQFGRFSYIEKAEYWALIWGTIIMGVTGFILWFDNTSMGLITKLGFDAARLIHFYEAILATLAIIVWHFYFVIFNPDIYPMNLAWLTGRMSEKEMLEEHPLELERLKKEQDGDTGKNTGSASEKHGP